MNTHFDTLFEGDKPLTKLCTVCNTHLPLSMFGRSSGGNYLRYDCKKCTSKLRHSINKIKKTVPSVPKNYRCPICLRDKDEIDSKKISTSKQGVWCLDHDHESGEFRGWLCHKCNVGIGNFSDDIERLTRAINYLKDSK